MPDYGIFLWLTPDYFTRQGETSRAGKGWRRFLYLGHQPVTDAKILVYVPSITFKKQDNPF